ncbi:hypothetical protein Tco_0442044 [Tanacetum coccineum]
MTESPLMDSGFAVPVFSPRDDLIACLNKAMTFLTVVASSRFPSTNNQLRTSSNPRNQATIQDGRVTVQQVQGRQGQIYFGTGCKSNATSSRGNNASGKVRVVKCYNCQYPGVSDGKAIQKIIPINAAFQTEDLDTYDSDCNDFSNAKAVLIANIFNYDSDVISEVPHSETYHNDMENQSVHAMHDFKQSPVVDFSYNEIHSDSNIIPYSQYLQETQLTTVQDTTLQAQQDSMILSVIEQMSEQMINHKFALKEQVDSLEQNRSKQIKEEESLLQTFIVFKNKSKEKENKYMENEIDLEKKIKELDNIIFKVGQSAQPVHMLTKQKRFVPQQELLAEQTFCYHMSNPSTKSSDASPVKMKAPKELPKLSLVNESLKKLKFHLAMFDNVVKIRTTPDARIEGEWGVQLTNNVLKLLKKNSFWKMIDSQQIMSQDVLLIVMNSMSLNGESVNMERKRNESCDKYFNLDAELLKTQNAHNDLLKSYSQLEKHCISLELSIQLNHEIFQKDKSCNNQNALEILEYFENNELKAQLQAKDTTIFKLKEHIKSMRENNKEEKVNHDISKLETINEELENSMAKLLSENEHLCKEINHVKQVFKDQFDSIKKTRVLLISSLKNDLRNNQRVEIIENDAQVPIATLIVLGMFKLDLDPLAPRLLQNREAHIDYLKYTHEQADILRGIVKQAKAKQPLDNALDFACKHVKQIQELLVYVQDTCPNAIKLSQKKVVVTPMNKVKKVRFSEPLTSSSNIKLVESSKTSDSNTPVLSSTGLKCSTSNCRSTPTGNKKNDRISQIPSSNKKNKVEAQPRKVNKKNHVKEPICDANVKHTKLNVNSELICVKCNDIPSSYSLVNGQTLREIFEIVSISLQTSVCHTHQQSTLSKGENQTSVEAAPNARQEADYRFFMSLVSLYYPTNDSEDLGKLNAKADIGSVHNLFILKQPCITKKRLLGCLFQPIFDEYFNSPTIDVSPVPVAATPRPVDIADSPVSMSIDQDAPSTSIPSTQDQEHSPVIS